VIVTKRGEREIEKGSLSLSGSNFPNHQEVKCYYGLIDDLPGVIRVHTHILYILPPSLSTLFFLEFHLFINPTLISLPNTHTLGRGKKKKPKRYYPNTPIPPIPLPSHISYLFKEKREREREREKLIIKNETSATFL
jgi:hypothetical protein